MKVHLDTDLGGDIDDLCALSMLLRWSGDIHLTGITTVAEAKGRRAGYVQYSLGLEGKNEIPVVAEQMSLKGFTDIPSLVILQRKGMGQNQFRHHPISQGGYSPNEAKY